jgi:hypothetical protein
MTKTTEADNGRVEHAAFMIGIDSDDTETIALLRVCDGYAGVWLEAVGRLVHGRDDVVSGNDAEIEGARAQMVASIYRAFVGAGWDGEDVEPFDGQFSVDGSDMPGSGADDEEKTFALVHGFVEKLAEATGFDEGDLAPLTEHLAVRAVVTFRTEESVAAPRR